MLIRFLNRLVVTGIIGIAGANASPGQVTITALNSPVWLQLEDRNIRLDRNSELKIGDNVSTGETGRIQMTLWENARLQLNTNSEITIRMENNADTTSSEPELYIHRGRACINYTAQTGSYKQFKVNMGGTMFADIHHHGKICVLRSDNENYIKLSAGSVQITQSVNPEIIILSETDSEIHGQDSGSYRLRFPGDEVSAVEIEKPFIFETDGEEVTPAGTPDTTDTAMLTETESGTAARNAGSIYVYTVYLFSTRDENVAQKTNQKFLKAGHDTQIIETTTDSIKRYRIAVTGFKSNQGAKTFAAKIVGKFGITETWIGRKPQ